MPFDLSPVLIFPLGVAFFVGLVVYAARTTRRRNDEIHRLARWRGWQFSVGHACSLSGTTPDGCFWTVNLSDEDTTWRTEAIRSSEHYLAISSRATTVVPDYSSRLMQWALRHTMGEREAEKLSAARRLEVGSAVFQQQYVAVGTDAELAARLLTRAVEHQLLDWPLRHARKCPAIHLLHNGLEVKVNSASLEAREIESLVALGEQLTQAAKAQR